MLWSMMRLIFKMSSVTSDFFYVFNLILSFSTCSESFEKICVWELLGVNVLNYSHMHFYALESIQNAINSDDSEEGLRHMTDKPMKNGRKYVDSEFVHDMMDNMNDEHYFL